MDNGLLNSWKEIASYIGRGVRTLQRWEHDLGLPVRRPRGKQRSPVIALKEELDLWLQRPNGEVAKRRTRINSEEHTKLRKNTELLRHRTSMLLARSDILQQKVLRAISVTSALQSVRPGRPNPTVTNEREFGPPGGSLSEHPSSLIVAKDPE